MSNGFFCNGKCKFEKETEEGTITKKCGLYAELIWEDKIKGKTNTEEVCVLWAIMTSLHRLEQANVRLQAAVESHRNEAVKHSEDINKTLATGLLGLIQTARGKNKKTVKLADKLEITKLEEVK